MERHTGLIPRNFVLNHGVHFRIVLRKLSFGSDYKSDFFFLTKSSIDWSAVFIEIEKPQSKFFRDKSNELHSDFQKAIHQIKTWQSWLSDSGNAAGFLSSISDIRVPRQMANHPTDFKFILVHGRRSEIENNDQRKQLIKSYQSENIKIISFDSLIEGIPLNYPLNIAVRKNEFLDIFGDTVHDGSIFSAIDPSKLRVSSAVQKRLEEGSKSPQHLVECNGEYVDAWILAAQKVRIHN
ncbi:hypothetical protein POI8812_00853 [Pontivivens insulae]|uniref:Shedu protein SduA C-terminal domain-containing protein n=2 Tax=Pontivivens insulae TaxID=1639689 RepID=A0A2R8A8K3_9RHOB|nr:hypothetical protein POI8812_00853 [Pontivivens insulae]